MQPAIEIRFHEPTRQWWLYVDAGTDPRDGAPLTWARPATAAEVVMWEMGDMDELRKSVQPPAPPVRKPSRLKRLLRRFGWGRQR